MDRRTFLKGGGVITVAVLGGGVWRAYDHGVFSTGHDPAYEPWKDWRTASGNGPLALVRAAILAASPHNTQPWLFKVSNSAIELYIDTTRNVGPLDPYLREEHIGMGCALENLMQAAAANGYQAAITFLPGNLLSTQSPKLLARVDLAAGIQERSELYDAIPNRHTNRGLYIPHEALPSEFISTLNGLVGQEPNVKIYLFQDQVEREKIVNISSAANSEIYSDPSVVRASDRWIRVDWRQVQKFRDGLTIDAFGLPPFKTAIVKIMPLWMLIWAASHGPKNAYSNLMLSAPLIGIIAVRDRYDQEQCLHAGRIWQRAHLLATARDLAGRPCNEAVEMIDYEKAHERPALRAALLGEIIGDAAWQPTFLFYMGYPTLAAHASPRRPVENVVV
jgi:nitroreductase